MKLFLRIKVKKRKRQRNLFTLPYLFPCGGAEPAAEELGALGAGARKVLPPSPGLTRAAREGGV